MRKIVTATAIMAALLPPGLPAQTNFATLLNFTDAVPSGLAAGNGILYGTSFGETPTGSNCGMIFELQPPPSPGGTWTQTVLYAFADTNDLCNPLFAPIPVPGGLLYGVTQGGASFVGSGLYELVPPVTPGEPWHENILYTFGGADGLGGAESPLIQGPDGSFYNLGGGGVYTNAVVQLRPPGPRGGPWTGSVICSVPNRDAGGGFLGPPNSLTLGPGGEFYVTIGGGARQGQIVRLTPSSTPGGACTGTGVHDFNLGPGNPNSLTAAADGTLYGTTYGFNFIGDQGGGAVFSLAPPATPGGAWTYTVLQNFPNLHPNCPLIMHGGNIYGALDTNIQEAISGGVFELRPPSSPGGAWTTTFLHEFTNGQMPDGNLLLDESGTLYGLTEDLTGTTATGTIYRVETQ